MEEKDLLGILAEYGSVKVITDNILLFDDQKQKVYLRYSMGETFSFLKGSAPIKIQTKQGFAIDRDKFKTNLDKVVQTEVDGGRAVEQLYLGGLHLNKIRTKIYEARPDYSFEIKGNRLVSDLLYARISINSSSTIEHTFNTEFLKIKDINKAQIIVFNLVSDIEQLKLIIKN